MRTILVVALAANVLFSAGSTYLQGALTSQAGAAVSTLASTASQPAGQVSEF
ncbi:MAG TPA: hypothetical protein VGC38_09195 [Pseudolabrys sp.]